jgi:hypothetical protein
VSAIAGIDPFGFLRTIIHKASDKAPISAEPPNQASSAPASGRSSPLPGSATNTLSGPPGAPTLSYEAFGAVISAQEQTSRAAPISAASGVAGSSSATPLTPAGLVRLNLGDPDENLFPTTANLQKHSAELAQSVNALLASAGISQSPPLSFSVDPNTAQVTVAGNRADTTKIQNLINSNQGLKAQFHQVLAEGSQLAAFQQGLKAVDAYFAAKTPAEIRAVLDQYYSGQSSRPPDITFLYNGSSIELDANGQPLSLSQHAGL